MAYLDPEEAFEHLQERVLTGLAGHFPMQGKVQSLHLDKLEAKDDLHPDDIRAQHKAKVEGGSWAVPVYAHLSLKDNQTGNVIDKRRIRIAEIPKMTRRYSYIVDGQEYQLDNQWQLKPGVYTKRRENGELETRFNVSGKRSFDVLFDPAKKEFHVEYGAAHLPIYPILKTMGVDDAALKNAWGEDILEANRKARFVGTALERFYKTDRKVTAPSREAAAEHVFNTLTASKLRPEATEVTLGKAFDHVSGDALRTATEKMLRVQGGAPEDDRDSLIFKDLRTVGDYAFDKLTHYEHKRSLQYKAARKINTAKDVRDVIKSDWFQKPILETFHKNAAARAATQINPLEMVSASQQTTIMGPGGIQSERSVLDEAKFVNPSHFGFLDPVQTPEGSKTGVTLRLPMGVHKVGNEAMIPLYNLGTKKMEQVSAATFIRSNVVLPDQVEWENGHPKPLSSSVKMAMADNVMREGKFSDAHYVMRHPSQLFNMTSNLIPFLGNTSGGRASMASRQMEQAISLVHREQPLVQVSTGSETPGIRTFEGLLGKQASHASPVSGEVVDVKKDAIFVRDGGGKRHEVQLYRHYPLNDAKGVMHSTPLVRVGDQVKEGQVVADTNFSRQGVLALGTNLRVAYLPFKGYNFEDGVVISESAAQKLTSEHLHKPAMKVDEAMKISSKAFQLQHPGVFSHEQLERLGEDGIVRVGQKVNPGDPLVAATKPFELKDRTGLSAIRRSMTGTHTDKALRWDSEVPGEVVGVHRKAGEIAVHVRTLEPMQVGDKLAGRYGNKGIVTMVLPDKEMPHTQDGRHIEVALNPSGVPGRMNVGQVLETAAAKIAEKTKKPYIVKNFEPGVDVTEQIKRELKAHGLDDQEELFDPLTGRALGKALVGTQHMLKLVHQVDKKLSVRSGMSLSGSGQEHYDLNLQPASGGGSGGQSMSSLGLYALLAHGAKANIREMQTYKSEGPDPQTDPKKKWPSQHNDVWAAIQTGAPLPTPKPTFAFQKFTDYLKAAGINMEKKGHELILSPLTDKQIVGMAPKALPKPGELLFARFDKNGEPKPKPGGLFDEELTGGHGGRKWARIDLAEPVPNPVFESAIRHVTGLKQTDFDAIVHGQKAVSPTGQVTEIAHGVTGGAGIKLLLDRIDVKKALPDARRELAQAKGLKVDPLLKKVKYLTALEKAGMKPSEAYVLHHLPVLPPVMRPVTVMDDGNLKYSDINGLYSEFAQLNDKLGDPVLTRHLSDTARADLRHDYYDGVKALTGMGIPYGDANHKGLLHYISGSAPKHGFFQDALVNRKQDLSMRSTIVPEPGLGLDEVGIPKHAALDLFRPFVIQKLVHMGAAPTALDAPKLLEKKGPAVWKALDQVMEERPVLLKRDPVLHKHSVQAFKARAVAGSAIQIHPLVTGGYNADFDGDCVLGDLIVVTLETSVGEMPHATRLPQVALFDIAAFPRVEETAVRKRSGVTEYDVPAGTYVPAYCAGRMEMRPVTKFSIHPNCEEWEVRTKNGREIICSSDHSLALLNVETLEVEKAPPRGAVGRCLPVLRDLAEPKLHETLPGSRPLHVRARPMVGNVLLDFATGWFLGASTGDGWVSDKTRNSGWTGATKEASESQSRAICLAYGADGRHVRDEWVRIGSALADGAQVGDTEMPHTYEGHTCSSYRCSISSTAMGLWLEDLMGKGAATKHLPPAFLEYPIAFRRGLFSGLVDTDGTVNWGIGNDKKKPQFALSFSTISLALAEGIQLLGLSLGLPATRTTYSHNDKPAYIVSFSSRPVQDARWIRLQHSAKRAALHRFWSSESIEFGRNDFVPMTPRARSELLELLRRQGATVRPPRRHPKAFAQYVVLQRGDDTITRTSAEKLFELCQEQPMSQYLTKWFRLALDRTVGWDAVSDATPTGEIKTMYDITVPDSWTFTMSNGAVVWDSMAMFVPIHQDAVAEARKMFPSNNLFSEATGKVMYQPTLESALGLYKLSMIGKDTGKKFASSGEAVEAVRAGKHHMTDVVHVGSKRTTAGRILLAAALPAAMQHKSISDLDHRLDKKNLDELLTDLAKNHRGDFGRVVDHLKDLGNGAAFGSVVIPRPESSGHAFSFSKSAPTASIDPMKTISVPMGVHSLGLSDFTTDKETRQKVLGPAAKEVKEIYANARIPVQDRDRRAVLVWDAATKKMRDLHEAKLDKDPTNLYLMYKAGIKPGWEQYKQMTLAPMLLTDSANHVIPTPVTNSYSEGLDVAGYWTGMHGARRGAVMKVQEVSEPGYMSKLMMQNMMHISVNSTDCGTDKGIALPVSEKDVHDRHLAQDFVHGSLRVPAGTLLTPDIVGKIRASKKDAQVIVRSPLRCEEEKGVCQKCMGLSASGQHHDLGTNVGIQAAHALGERAIQLTLKSFHTGGVQEQAGGSKLLSSFSRFEQLMYLDKKIPDAATLAMKSGRIDKIEETPTGVDIHIGGQVHHVGKDKQGMALHEILPGSTLGAGYVPWAPPKIGSHIEAGQHLSDPNRTFINPHDLYKATGSIEKVQNHLTSEIYDLYKDEGLRRRGIETVVRAMSDLTKVDDPGDHPDVLRGEFRSLSSIRRMNSDLAKQKKQLIEHTPVLKGVEMLPLSLQEDWMAKLQHQRLRDTLAEAASTLGASNLHGSHPIPGIAYGAEFGLTKTVSKVPGFRHLENVPAHSY